MKTEMLTCDRLGPIQLGRQIGNRGGGGAVYEILGQPNLVVKLYHTPPKSEKLEKLVHQSRLRDPELLRISAWPQSIIRRSNTSVGFAMPKVGGKSIHLLYRPVDRKENFPSITWQNLVHVCQNIAASFHILHSRNILMGDVNETNIIVTPAGETRFIDCDSFQISTPEGKIHRCEVGVPLWTPPELQGVDFSSVHRTPQHDLFGLASMIFHILFMGRHPFAGVPRSKAALEDPQTLEHCIAHHQFAFTRKARVNLDTPPHSITLSALPDKLADLFEQAFLTTNRPPASVWYHELKDIQFHKCQWGHYYIRQLPECPWCKIWNKGGPNFFVVRTDANETALSGIEVERLIEIIANTSPPVLDDPAKAFSNDMFILWRLPKLEELSPPKYSPTPLNISKFRTAYAAGWIVIGAAVFGFLFDAGLLPFCFMFGVTGGVMVSSGRVNHNYQREILRRKEAVPKAHADVKECLEKLALAGKKWQQTYAQRHNDCVIELRKHQNDVIKIFETKRSAILANLKSALLEYRGLPNRKKLMEEERRERAQREDFLRQYRISSHSIPQIGPTRSAILANYGVETAWDVKHMGYIPRLGQGAENLRIWLSNIEANFRYRPNIAISDITKQEIARDISKIEQKITSRFQSLRQEWFSVARECDGTRLHQLRETRYAELKVKLNSVAQEASAEHAQLTRELNVALENLGRAIAGSKFLPE